PELAEILLDIVGTPVSPELLPGAQITEDIIGPYELHDFFLYNLVKYGFAPSKVAYMAKYAFEGVFDAKTVDKWLAVFCRRFINQQFKRSCLSDGPLVTEISLSPRRGINFPSDASNDLFLADLKQ
ncbi:MAG: NAD(+) synthase, partial [Clostridia bacterium]|nr:NAD(+) synthase [Clostridia bacterium]